MTALRIPEVTDDADIITAAIAYARAGWYVLPVEPDTKRPAKILGNKWQHKTSNDPMEIADWFAGTNLMLALHVGRSGAVALDVDSPDDFPKDLVPHLLSAPFQSTRDNDPRRGHYIFTVPEGRVLGNGRGELGQAFGEVRGTNGIIVVAPSAHTKDHGRYHWVRTGEVPVLPPEISSKLPNGQRAEDVADDKTVADFIAENNHSEMAHLLKPVLAKFVDDCTDARGSRHEALVRAAVWGMREARAGYYPAQSVIDGLWQDFEAYMAGDRFPRNEFKGVIAWAVSQALATDPVKRKAEVQGRLAAKDAAQKASVQTTAPVSVTTSWQPPRRPDEYFGKEGIDAELLARDAMDMGPLLWGRDGGFWSYKNGVWKSDPHVVEARTVRLLGPRFRGNHASNAATMVRHYTGEINVEPIADYMNFTNGMLDWRTGELIDHAPHFGSTVQFPLAWTGDKDTPLFDKFLSQILSPDYIEYTWEMLGYMLFSGNPLQVAFMLLGNGRNGKGTLMRVIEHMLGPANCAAVDLDSLSNNRFAAASLFGRIANLAGDIDPTFQENTGKFKKLTGGDMLDAEEKHRQSFRYTCWAVPMFSANKAPGSADTSFGYLRRWKIIKFDRQITDSEVDPDLDDKLAAELPAVAARAVEALRVLMVRRNFKSEGEVAQGEADFATKIDQVRQWVEEECTLTEDHRELQTTCYSTYKMWADRNGNGRLRAGEFYSRLENAGFHRVKSSGTWFVVGLKIKGGGVRNAADPVPEPYAT